MGTNIDGQQPIQQVYDTVSNNAAESQEYTQEQFVEDFTSAFEEVKAQEEKEGTASGSGVSTTRFHGSFLGKVEASTGQAIDPNSDQGKAILSYMYTMADSGASNVDANYYDEDYFNQTELELAMEKMPAASSYVSQNSGGMTPDASKADDTMKISSEEADFESRGGAKATYRQDLSNDGLTYTLTLADGTKAVYTREKGTNDWKFDSTQYQPAQAQAEPVKDNKYDAPPKAAEDEDSFWGSQGTTTKEEPKAEKEEGGYTPPPKAAEDEDKGEAAATEQATAKAESFNEKVQNAAKKELLDLSYDFSYGDGFVQTYDQALENLSNTIALHYNIPTDQKDAIEAKCAEILSNNGRSNSTGNALMSILRIANNGQGRSDDYLKW